MRILVVDDQEISRKTLKSQLMRLGHEVIECENGEQVLQMHFCGELPQIIFLDWMMPGVSGLEVCQKIRQSSVSDSTYIFIVTARTAAEDIVQSLRSGANDYLGKPVDKHELESRLTVALQYLGLQKIMLEHKSKLIESEKMANLGDITAGMAQELKPFLGDFRKGLDRISLKLEGSEKTIASQMYRQLEQAEKVIFALKDFSENPASESCELMTMQDIISMTMAFAGPKLQKYKVDFRVKNFDPFVQIEARKIQIAQLLNILLVNSIEAIQALPEKWIEFEVLDTDKELMISVTDSGYGIIGSIREKMFNPFYSSKKHENHTGLGLNIASSIIELHGGNLKYDERSVNTRFVIRIPKNQQVLKLSENEQAAAS